MSDQTRARPSARHGGPDDFADLDMLAGSEFSRAADARARADLAAGAGRGRTGPSPVDPQDARPNPESFFFPRRGGEAHRLECSRSADK